MSEERQDPAEARSWTKLTFTGKDFITFFLFIVTLSGSYYNGVYKQESFKAEVTLELKSMKDELQDRKENEKQMEQTIRQLQDDKLQRDAIERDRVHSGYGPMQQVK